MYVKRKEEVEMNISMAGIDYHTANIVQRGQYALKNDKVINLGRYFIQEKLAYGCVILATCNRTEIWFSGVIGKQGDGNT